VWRYITLSTCLYVGSLFLYRLWHKLGPILAFLWYIIAFSLFTSGHEQLWMIIVGPFVYCIPLGGLSATAARTSSSEDNNEFPNVKGDGEIY